MNLPSTRPAGTLYIVATPIGNRDDMTIRALAVLKAVDFVLAEDTRHSAPLLRLFGVNKPLFSLHIHNEEKQSLPILSRLLAGESAALISDAGTPLICDPGYPLVIAARRQGIQVVPIPGACALIAALSAAGVPSDVFTFVGFLPAKSIARRAQLTTLSAVTHTLIFYEATHRILACMEDVAFIFGEACELVLAKELTKTFECFVAGSVLEVKHWLTEEPVRQKGEFVVMIPPRKLPACDPELERFLSILCAELPLKQAVSLTSRLTGVNKNTVYSEALKRGRVQ